MVILSFCSVLNRVFHIHDLQTDLLGQLYLKLNIYKVFGKFWHSFGSFMIFLCQSLFLGEFLCFAILIFEWFSLLLFSNDFHNYYIETNLESFVKGSWQRYRLGFVENCKCQKIKKHWAENKEPPLLKLHTSAISLKNIIFLAQQLQQMLHFEFSIVSILIEQVRFV